MFPAIIQVLPHTTDTFHLSSSNERYYISAYINVEDLPNWFNEETCQLLKKLKPSEGIHCHLVPAFSNACLNEKELNQISEHDAKTILTLEDLRNRNE